MVYMRINKLFILSLFLLAVVTIGAVSAEDNMTVESLGDDSSEDDVHLETSYEDDSSQTVLGDDSRPELDIRLWDEEIAQNNNVTFELYEHDDGDFNVSLDGVKISPKNIVKDWEYMNAYHISTKGLSLGSHSLLINFANSSYYKDTSKNFTFIIKNIVINMPDEIFIGENDYIYVECPNDATGYLSVTVDDKQIFNEKIANRWIQFDNLDLGIHKFVFKYYNGNYKDYNITYELPVSYRIIADDCSFEYSDENMKYGFKAPHKLSVDKLVVKVDNTTYEPEWRYGNVYSIYLKDLEIGKHNVSITYLGDEKFPMCSNSSSISVGPSIDFYDELNVGEDKNITATMPENFNGALNAYVDDEFYASAPFINGVARISMGNMKIGKHKLFVNVTGVEGYEFIHDVTVDVDIFIPFDVDVGESYNITLNLPKDAKGNVTANFNGEKVSAEIKDGVAEIPIPADLKVGNYKVAISHNGDNYTFNVYRYFTVEPSFKIPYTVTNGKESVSLELPYSDNIGKLQVKLYGSDEYSFTKKLVNGKASISLDSVNAGKYWVIVNYYDGKDYYTNSKDIVVKNSKLTASNLKTNYQSGSSFKLKVQSYKGKIVKSGKVKFYINGKYVKTVKTNKKGYAYLKITKAPCSYKITAKYGNVKITRTLTVKHIVILKSATVKKSAKKLTLKATVKQGKKALKYKKVTFKFNGKTYKTKTNKYGVAKVTIKKSVLKKLKVGKTVKYQVSYLKDTVKKSAKVKK